jgi:hypothetical protein
VVENVVAVVVKVVAVVVVVVYHSGLQLACSAFGTFLKKKLIVIKKCR